MKLTVVTMAIWAFSAIGPLIATAEPGNQSSAPSASDPATEVVAMFYQAILRETQPTLNQEHRIFLPDSRLRENLVAVQGYIPEEPVILQLLRKHKDLFLPKGFRGPRQLLISSSAAFVRDLERPLAEQGRRFVVALAFGGQVSDSVETREIVFEVEKGRIDPDTISLSGFAGGPKDNLFERFAKRPPATTQPAEVPVAVTQQVKRWNAAIATELPRACSRQQAEAWFAKHGIGKGKIRVFWMDDTTCDRVSGKTPAQWAGLRDADLGGMLRGFIAFPPIKVGSRAYVGAEIYFFFDKQKRCVGHLVYPDLTP